MAKEFDVKEWVINTLRRASNRTRMQNDVRNAAKRPVPLGYPNKRLKFLHHCNLCQLDFPRKETEVDHIHPMIPVTGWSKIESGALAGKFDFNQPIYNLLEGTLQVICKPCHRKKSKQENAIRRTLKKMFELTLAKNQNINDWETALLKDIYPCLGTESPKKSKRKKRV